MNTWSRQEKDEKDTQKKRGTGVEMEREERRKKRRERRGEKKRATNS